MKKVLLSISILFFTLQAYAGPSTMLGGKRLDESNAHYVALGWPSMAYEWWTQGGNMDWGVGGELVYGDWSGEFSDVDIGFALNIPMKWHLSTRGRADFALKFAPGAMIGTIDTPGDNIFLAAVRGEFGVPISISVNEQVNVLTGVSVPFTIMFVEGGNDYVIIPILPRIGIEFIAADWVTPFFLAEVGPTFAAGNGGASDVEFGLRASIGAAFF